MLGYVRGLTRFLSDQQKVFRKLGKMFPIQLCFTPNTPNIYTFILDNIII